MTLKSLFDGKSSYLRHHPSYHIIIRDPSSRLDMSPDTIIPHDWNVDSLSVYSKIGANFDGGFDPESKIVNPIAHERSENVYVLDNYFQYLSWLATSDHMAEIKSSYEVRRYHGSFGEMG